ncbi:MAG: methyltransferase domain-containing protein [Acidobacteriota bacterium]
MNKENTDESSSPLHERQACGIRLLKSAHPDLRRLKAAHKPSLQGHKAWNSTYLLLDFLQDQPLPQGLRVLDVGCGWGLLSIFCARRFAAAVTAADIDEQVFPFLQLHARLNQVEVQTLHASFAEIPDSLLYRQDLLVGADICFRDSMIDPLYSLFCRALDAGVSRIILADPGRFPFHQLATRCVQALGASEIDWSTQEPTVVWSGASPQIRGRLLLVDRTPAKSLLSRSPA